MVTPLLRVLKEDGYHVTYNCTERGDVLRGNPFIDKFLHQKTNEIPAQELDVYWKKLAEGYDKFINLSESIEGSLLTIKGREAWNWSHEKRDAALGSINYYDRTLEIGGYPHIKGRNPEMFFSGGEETQAREFRKKYKGKFLVMWSLSGSSFHKVYPYTEMVAREFLHRHEDAMTLTMGDDFCRMLEWSHPRSKNYSGNWPIRKTLLMTKYVDLVVATETGIANGVACFDTPKIILLSHSSEENLTKYWKNVYPIHADVPCYPCHKLHYTMDTCPIDQQIYAPVCMSKLDPTKILEKMEETYLNWKERRTSVRANRSYAHNLMH